MGTDIFSMALDALMIVAITGLWIMWFQQTAQRKKVEKMLKEASDDLQAATQLLDQVMVSIAEQQNISIDVQKKETDSIADASSATDEKVNNLYTSSAIDVEQEARQHSNLSAKIMRLNREGLDAEGIADKLDVPIAQVRLMLLLQAPKM